MTNPFADVMRLINGYRVSQALHVVAVLGIADLLATGPRSSDDLAQATGTDAGSLYRAMWDLAAVAVLMSPPIGAFRSHRWGRACSQTPPIRQRPGLSSSVGRISGGQGALLGGILAANPGLQGVVFDQPHVVAHARPGLERMGVAERCVVAAGNSFESVPWGDLLILKAILHDWEDDEAHGILRTCRKAVGGAGKLLVIERVLAKPHEGRTRNLPTSTCWSARAVRSVRRTSS